MWPIDLNPWPSVLHARTLPLIISLIDHSLTNMGVKHQTFSQQRFSTQICCFNRGWKAIPPSRVQTVQYCFKCTTSDSHHWRTQRSPWPEGSKGGTWREPLVRLSVKCKSDMRVVRGVWFRIIFTKMAFWMSEESRKLKFDSTCKPFLQKGRLFNPIEIRGIFF